MKFLADIFTRFMKKYMPDAFIFSILLTVIVIVAALFVPNSKGTSNSIFDIITYWGSGFWGLLGFAMQMALIVATGTALASSKPVNALLGKIADRLDTPVKAIAGTAIVATIACWLQYGFGLIAGALLARKVATRTKGVHYPILVAAAYSGFLVWHGGLSASIPLRLATPGVDAALNQYLGAGSFIPVTDTIFSPFNLTLSLILLITIPITFILMMPKDPSEIVELSEEVKQKFLEEEKEVPAPTGKLNFAEYLEHTPLITVIACVLGFVYLFLYFKAGKTLSLDSVLIIFLFLGLALHKTPHNYLVAFKQGVAETSGILMQFPFYAGIMGIMIQSGLGATITEFFISVANANTLPVYTFWVSGLINLFVPSGGGQWAVQSHFILDSAMKLGADIPKTVLAVSWGDAWTNMIQPFWALPLLGVARMDVKDIMGYTAVILIVSGVIISGLIYVF